MAAVKTTVLSEDQEFDAVNNVLLQLRSIIRQAVQRVLSRLQAAGTLDSFSDEELITKIRAEMSNGLLLRLLKAEIQKIIGQSRPLPPQNTLNDLLQIMLPQIRQHIIAELNIWREENATPELSNSQIRQISGSIISLMTSQVEGATIQLLRKSSSSISDDEVVGRINAQFQPLITDALDNDATIQHVFSSASFADSDYFVDLLARITSSLRSIILRTITEYRASQVVITTRRPVTPKPAGGNPGCNSNN